MEGSILQDALSLKRSNNEVVKFIVELDAQKLSIALQAFSDLKKKIKTYLIDTPVLTVHDCAAQDVLIKIQQDYLFEADKILTSLASNSNDDFVYDSLDFDELNDMQDYLYRWFSHHEYVQGLFDIGSLIVGLSIPDSLTIYVSEARECYAFQQYNAVYGICRTILEIAIRYRCQRKGILKFNKRKVIDIDEYHPSELINKCTQGGLRDSVKTIYKATSSLLHGSKTVNSDDARLMFKDTLKVVQDLYKH
ncbi:MAG: hypothetical protein GY710_00770 [Desulfobacteraceae bacterium]|nr:hypothetical protein [Desulfobacteraceae bacterium]